MSTGASTETAAGPSAGFATAASDDGGPAGGVVHRATMREARRQPSGIGERNRAELPRFALVRIRSNIGQRDVCDGHDDAPAK